MSGMLFGMSCLSRTVFRTVVDSDKRFDILFWAKRGSATANHTISKTIFLLVFFQ